jgi:hypothetical protein
VLVEELVAAGAGELGPARRVATIDYKGAIADVQAWDVARSPAELAAGPASSDWTARWSFTERAGDAACDDAGSACWDLVRLGPGAWRDIPAP